MKLTPILMLVTACLSIAACNQQNNKTVDNPGKVADTPKKPAIEEPFKYHKMIEVAPGQYYDVLSWGRGTNDGGAYMILRSDSADQQYNSITGNLEGPIQDVLNADLDTDGNPEIIIQAKSIDTTRFTNIFAYEYHNNIAVKLEFPRLTTSQRKGYRGNDNFYIKDSKLMREFIVYDGSGATAKPSGQKRLLEYSLHSNSFSVKQLSKDSTSALVANPVQAETQREKVKKVTSSKSAKHSSVSKHHRVAEKHRSRREEVKKKRKKRRH